MKHIYTIVLTLSISLVLNTKSQMKKSIFKDIEKEQIAKKEIVRKIENSKGVVDGKKVEAKSIQVTDKVVENRRTLLPILENGNFIQEFLLSFSLNFFSEIGDKSFVSIILVYNQISPYVLFMVAVISELLMNLFSVIIGHQLRTHPLVKVWCHLFGSLTALLFGLLLIYEVYFSKEEEKKEDIELAQEIGKEEKKSSWTALIKISNIAWIIFISEFGDKSQITTIILSAEYSPIPIFLGTAVAHILGVLLSMTIGFIISKSINKKILTTIGALCFIYFGVQTGISFSNEGGFELISKQLNELY
jgi:putative Ca2+/H+ antiporter (TMEM165/GDT1 family)